MQFVFVFVYDYQRPRAYVHAYSHLPKDDSAVTLSVAFPDLVSLSLCMQGGPTDARHALHNSFLIRSDFLWYSGQSSGYRSRCPGFDSRRYQIVDMERGPLSLVRLIEELF
jgi:hypothetical protein